MYRLRFKVIEIDVFVFQVREINFADRGQHPLGYFAADIAVLIVRERLKFDRFVLPACVDWRSTRVFNPGPNATGRVINYISLTQSRSDGEGAMGIIQHPPIKVASRQT